MTNQAKLIAIEANWNCLIYYDEFYNYAKSPLRQNKNTKY